jgi:hypothetical protein
VSLQTTETGDDVDRRALGNRLVDDLAQQVIPTATLSMRRI